MKSDIRRIHIMGSIGSGKTTLARNLSAKMAIPYYELDNVVRIRSPHGDMKRSPAERDAYLEKIILQKDWIVEGVHHTWISPCIQHADLIIFLDTNYPVRKFRIIKRFILQKIGLEKANYKPTLKILKDLYRYNAIFEHKSKHEIFEMLQPYRDKLIVLKNRKEEAI